MGFKAKLNHHRPQANTSRVGMESTEGSYKVTNITRETLDLPTRRSPEPTSSSNSTSALPADSLSSPVAGSVLSPRATKSGNDWTLEELKAYNITVESRDFASFFGQPVALLEPMDIVTATSVDELIKPDEKELFLLIDLIADATPGQESNVPQFTKKLLNVIGYETLANSVVFNQKIPFFICGSSREATADICLIDISEILLLVQDENPSSTGAVNTIPRLISGAIAAFQFNNYKRTKILNEPALTSKVMAGITMLGTCPTFFKIPVTQELAYAVEIGEFPTAATTVSMHLPEVPRPPAFASGGMQPLDNRKVILECYEAFRQYL